ncbi:methyl-accepting chemotaxis protein [Alkalibaculum bacchi]|uniref:methyl-accepting chemotaxis protein n=1 Tax=Alkalibaculum bacchi TaxID=645887 RepID=UPI0026EAE6CA|nr:methyl-accepting chemotaxis protein [Alkalibaculum bacchi]
MSENIFNNEVLNAFHTVIDYLPILMDEPTAIYITDEECYRVVRDVDEIPMKGKVDVPIIDSIREVVKDGNPFVGEFEGSGAKFKSYNLPIKDENGKIAGHLLMAKSLKRKQEVQNAAENIKSSLEQITMAISDLNVNLQQVVDSNQEMVSIVQESTNKTKDTNNILNFIQEISSQTNLLGLNAAIEAARAGEYGRGFDVVAKEIRKLSSSTSESVKKVDDVLKNVSDSINNLNNKILNSNQNFEVQASSLEEIAASIEELNSSAEIMHNLAEKL